VLADRAGELSSAGEHRVACHLAELAGRAAPDDPAVHRLRAQVYAARAEHERSVMAKGVYRWAQRESERILDEPVADS
jgi:hypothetical protein